MSKMLTNVISKFWILIMIRNGEFNIFQIKKYIKSMQHKDDQFLMKFGLSIGISGFVKISAFFIRTGL